MVHLHIEVIFSWTFLELVIVIWTISFNMQNSNVFCGSDSRFYHYCTHGKYHLHQFSI